MGSKLIAVVIAAIAAAALGDALAHPAGTKAAGGAVAGILRPTLQASAGQKIT